MRALIFDFDGLILDTESTDFEAWARLYREHGHELPRERWVETIGTAGGAWDPVAHLGELIGRDLDSESVRAERRPVRDTLVRELDPLPGVVDWLEAARARGLALAIASSSEADWVVRHLRHVGLDHYFAEIVTADQVERAKPSPDLYQRALAKLEVAADDALALEDSAHGLAAARAAGLRCVAVPGPMTRHLDFAGAALVLDSLAERTLDSVRGELFGV